MKARPLLTDRIESEMQSESLHSGSELEDSLSRESLEKLTFFVEHAPAALAMFDDRMRYLCCSRRWKTSHRIEDDRDIIGSSHYEVIPEIPEAWRQAHRRGLSGEVLRAEADRFERSDGSVQWIRWEILPWKNAAGKVGGILIYVEDVTELKRIQQNEMDARGLAQATIDALAQNICVLDESGVIVAVNKAWREFARDASIKEGAGIASETLRLETLCEGVNYLQVCDRAYGADSEGASEFAQGIRDVLNGARESFSSEYAVNSFAQNRWFLVRITRFNVGQQKRIAIQHIDITGRKRVEDALRLEQSRSRLAFKAAKAGSWTLNFATNTGEWSQEMWELHGLAPRTTAPSLEEWFLTMHQDDVSRVEQRVRAVLQSGLSELYVEFRVVHPNGEIRWLSSLGRPIFDSNHKPSIHAGIVQDITERKRAEAALNENEQRLRELSANLLMAQEEERRSLARELHDDLTQRLAFISVELSNLAASLPGSYVPERTRIQALQDHVSRASSEMRRISHGLHPTVIEDFGLSSALEELCEEVERARHIPIHFKGTVEDSRLSNTAATCLYRIAQESVHNAVKHGRPRRISVSLADTGDCIELRI